MTEPDIVRNLEITERALYLITNQMQELVTEVITGMLDRMKPGREEPNSRKLLRALNDRGTESPKSAKLRIVPPSNPTTVKKPGSKTKSPKRASLHIVPRANQ